MSWNRFRRKRHVLIVSDATGRTAELLVQAALAQFKGTDVDTEVIGNVRSRDQIPAIFQRASMGSRAMTLRRAFFGNRWRNFRTYYSRNC